MSMCNSCDKKIHRNKYQKTIIQLALYFYNYRCKEEFSRRETLISSPDTVPRLCRFAIFIVELFLVLEVRTLLIIIIIIGIA